MQVGANINLPDNVQSVGESITGGDTPVHIAYAKKHTAIADFLFSSPGADGSILNASGRKARDLVDIEEDTGI